MKRSIFVTCGIAFCMLTGCASPETEKTVLQAAAEEAEEVVLGNRILHAIQRQNFMEFAQVLGGKLAYHIDEKDFRSSCRNMESKFGPIVSYRFLMPLRTPLVQNLVWVVTCERIGSDEKKYQNDVLFRLVCGKDEHGIRILALGFF